METQNKEEEVERGPLELNHLQILTMRTSEEITTEQFNCLLEMCPVWELLRRRLKERFHVNKTEAMAHDQFTLKWIGKHYHARMRCSIGSQVLP